MIRVSATIRNPEKWPSRRTPRGWNDDNMRRQYCTCDHCNRWYKFDDLHNPIYPVTDYDCWLQKQLHIEKAEGYCADCFNNIERQADAIDPDWNNRRWSKFDKWLDLCTPNWERYEIHQ
ncbi:MAG: hypothetical protein ABI947_14405 [Chloroflexota bacterium]